MSTGKTKRSRRVPLKDPFQRDLSAWINPDRIRLSERVLSELNRLEKQLLKKIAGKEV